MLEIVRTPKILGSHKIGDPT